jgi:phosphoglycerate dehydrogenase-like enzyme
MDDCRVWLRLDLPDADLERLRRDYPHCEFRRGGEREIDPAWLRDVDVIYAEQPISDDVLAAMPHLRWLQVTWSAGSRFLTPSLLNRPIEVTTSRGIHGERFSEFGLACIFALAKKLPQCWEQQQRHEWREPWTEEVGGKTLFVVGLGIVGTALARKADALGMHVIASKRTPGPPPPFVAELGTADALVPFLRRADFVVLCLPEVPSCAGVLGAAELRAMKPTAYLVNLSPKCGIAEDVLVRALRERWIAGAALDALPREPLPPDSALWSLPNALITPRAAQGGPPPWRQRLPIFERNLRTFLAGEPLPEAIDKTRGY